MEGQAGTYGRPESALEFNALESLPCGCVSAAYVARPWDVPVVSLEAKGPHCVFGDHVVGRVLQLGDLLEPYPELHMDDE